MMKSVICALFLVLAVVARAQSERPNVVVIVADDMGWNEVSYHNGFARTPNIDRIAHSGVELDRFYVSPICSPTRAGLMTGRYALHLGMGRSVVRPWADFGLPVGEQTIADCLGDAGYTQRAAFGKWHLGHLEPKWHPLARGFTYYKGCYNGAIDYFTREREGQVDWHENWNDIDEQGYTTDLIADTAVNYIGAHAKEPFFCYVAFTAPHEPLQAPQKYVDHYPNLKVQQKRELAAMVECMDDGIGRILKAIDDAGVQKNTLIWFISDNGGIRLIPANNAPLRGNKQTVYEGGVRVPSAVWWPGKIEGGKKIEAMMGNIDMMPTIAHFAGAKPKAPVAPLDGMDVSSALLGQKFERNGDWYHFTGQEGSEREQIAVTTPEGWKLIVIGPDVRREGGFKSAGHRVELYNVLEDPSEKTDRAKEKPELVEGLGKKLVAFRATEPKDFLTFEADPPAGFKPPVHWRNAPK